MYKKSGTVPRGPLHRASAISDFDKGESVLKVPELMKHRLDAGPCDDGMNGPDFRGLRIV